MFNDFLQTISALSGEPSKSQGVKFIHSPFEPVNMLSESCFGWQIPE
jgi:hypothetical protein